MVNTQKPSKMQGESWKFQWWRQCLAKKGTKQQSGLQETEAKSEESNKIPRQSMHASWRFMSQETTFGSSPPKDHEDDIAGKGNNSMAHYQFGAHFFRCLKRCTFWMRKQQRTRNGRSSKRFQPGSWTKLRAKRRLFLEAHRDKKKVHLATLMDICHLKNAELEPKNHKCKGRVVRTLT